MNDRTRRRCYKPFPELVAPRRGKHSWTIVDSNATQLPSNGVVDLGRQWMAVPWEPEGRSVCRHELAHVKWTPKRMPRVRFDPRLLAATEDARINLGLVALGKPVVVDRTSRARACYLLAEDAKREDAVTLLMRAVASIGTDVYEDFLEALDGMGRLGALVRGRAVHCHCALERARKRAGGEVAPFRAAHRLAREQARALRAHGLAGPESHLRASEACCLGSATGRREDAPGTGLLDLEGFEATGRGRGEAGDEYGAGEMSVHAPPLPHRLLRRRSVGIGRGPATEGSVVRYLQRWPLDRAVFAGPRRHRGHTTVLVDASGSMSLEVGDIERLLSATPAGVRVALYSGKGQRGELCVVADRGRHAAAEDLVPMGRGNIVDLPALEWLGEQKGQRIWVSDGNVTGVDDRPTDTIAERANELCRKSAVLRLENLKEAERWLLQRAQPGQSEIAR